MARKAAKPGEWWFVFAALLLCGGGLMASVAGKHGARVSHLRAEGMVTMATIVGKHEEERVIDRPRRADSSYEATFFDLRYAPYPSTTWAQYAAGGDAVLAGDPGGASMQASVNTGSREVFDSHAVGDRVAVVVDSDDRLNPALASFVASFSSALHWGGAVLLGLLGLAAGWRGWQLRQRARLRA
ncbi:MAG: hypothetical protein KDE15_10825 [Erythrobacter sp.]|nr:hypothetical protein [Erythrobacter sp.]